jgi:cellulose synthase/poly-beta-1,6-N-acetylglucosamine synthase-like glycosyltransferase
MLNPFLFAELVALLLGLVVAPHLAYYGYIRKYHRETKPSTSGQKGNIKVSIIICTLNASKTIERRIEQILRQDYSLDNLELIIVDGGSTDGTIDVIGKVKEKIPSALDFVLISDRSFRSKASQINEGIRVAKSDIVVTTDADVETDRTSIASLVDSLSEEEVGAVCARQILINPHQNTVTKSEAEYRRYYEVLRIGESNIHSTPIYHGGLSAYRRNSISHVDEDVNADDTQLAISAIRKGFRAVYDTNCVFYNQSPPSLRSAWRQRVRRGQGLERVLWRNRDMFLNRKFDGFGSIVFPAEFFMHVISPILFGGALVCLVLSLISIGLSSPTVGLLVIPVWAAVITFVYLKRSWRPVELLITFVVYQAALLWAMILHLFGQDYKRWSGAGRI